MSFRVELIYLLNNAESIGMNMHVIQYAINTIIDGVKFQLCALPQCFSGKGEL